MGVYVDNKNIKKNRVVVTGIGVHNSIGKNKEEVIKGLKEGKNGIKDIPRSRFDKEDRAFINKRAHLLDEETFQELQGKDESVVTELSRQVIGEAIHDSNLNTSEIQGVHTGISLAISTGTSFSFIKWLQKKLNDELSHKDLSLVLRSTQSITGDIANYYSFKGPSTTISTACASGTISLGTAYEKIAHGDVQYMIAGGVDLITILSFTGFNSLKNVSPNLCSPFDKNRQGLVLGEGAGFVVLESYENAIKRGADIYAELSGYSYINEAYHPTSPHPEGDYAYECMRMAMNNAQKKPEEINYINAHGTATKINDLMEYKAIKRLVGNHNIYVSSTKSLTGHTLGAAGSIEFIHTALGIKNGFIAPTINTGETIIDEDNICFPSTTVEESIDVAISNSFGFGGNMASIILNKA